MPELVSDQNKGRSEETFSLEVLVEHLKIAFRESNFDEARAVIAQIQAVEPAHEFAGYIAKKIEKSEEKAKKKALEAANKANRKPISVIFKEHVGSVKDFFKNQKAKLFEMIKREAPETQNSDGNTFTNLFSPQNDEIGEKSIIDTIVEQTDHSRLNAMPPKEAVSPEPSLKWLSISKLSLQLALAFIALTGAFFYVQVIDSGNLVMGFVGSSGNFASRLHAASESLSHQKRKEESLISEVKQYEQGYKNKYEQTIQGIISRRMDWPTVIVKVNEVANSLYEHNDLSQYIKFTSYSFNALTKQVVLTGTLTDPLGQNLTKLTELEAAFGSYPNKGSTTGTDDSAAPYFYDVEGDRNLGKSLGNEGNQYMSSFRFSFYLEKPKEAVPNSVGTPSDS